MVTASFLLGSLKLAYWDIPEKNREAKRRAHPKYSGFHDPCGLKVAVGVLWALGNTCCRTESDSGAGFSLHEAVLRLPAHGARPHVPREPALQALRGEGLYIHCKETGLLRLARAAHLPKRSLQALQSSGGLRLPLPRSPVLASLSPPAPARICLRASVRSHLSLARP